MKIYTDETCKEEVDYMSMSESNIIVGELSDLQTESNTFDPIGMLMYFANWIQSDTANLNYDSETLVEKYLNRE